MSTIFELGLTATTVVPIAKKSIKKDPNTKKFNVDEGALNKSLKNAATTVGVTSAMSSTQYCAQEVTLHSLQLYQESLTEEQIYRYEQLLAAKENEFVINGITYDLTQVDQSEQAEESLQRKDAKVLGKNL